MSNKNPQTGRRLHGCALFNKDDTGEVVKIPLYGRVQSVLELNELHCKCDFEDCSFTIINPALLEAFKKLRIAFNEPLRITSAYRCQRHNAVTGGVKNSYHMKGMALDVQPWNYIDEQDIQAKLRLIEKMSLHCFNFVLRYKKFVHVDVGHKRSKP